MRPTRFLFAGGALSLGLAAFGALGACHPSTPATVTEDASPPPTASGPAYNASFHPLDSDGHVLRDAQGRSVILRGYNIKVNGIFDVTPDNGDPVREIIPPLDATDLLLMQKSGVNVIRLPVSWSAFEPQKGAYQASYLAAIEAFLNVVRPYGIYVLLDFHEDGWSKDICEDGAPAWATVVTDDSGAAIPGGDCHTFPAALSAHQNFFEQNADDLEDAFSDMFVRFASYFVNDDLVFAYEIFNEPIASDESVDAFSIKIAKAIRTVDPRHLILWEPSSLRNQVNSSFVSPTPFPVPGCVYAIHVYETVPGVIAYSMQNAVVEAQAWGEPLFITEHGASPAADGGISWIGYTLDQFDQALASSMDWIWNPGIVTRSDAGAIQYVDDGGLYAELTRPYAMAVGGDLTDTTWDGTTLTVSFQDHPGVPLTHDVYWNRGTPKVTCDGEAVTNVTSDPVREAYTVACGTGGGLPDGGGHTLVFASSD